MDLSYTAYVCAKWKKLYKKNTILLGEATTKESIHLLYVIKPFII